MNRSDEQACSALFRQRRWAALATVGDAGPLASMVAFVAEPDSSAVLLHLSNLARHTANLVATRQASLVISEDDSGEGDPQTLARLVVNGEAEVVERESPDHAHLRSLYLARLPTAEPLFGFADFNLFRLRVESANYVGGFARAYGLTPDQLAGLR